MLINIGLDLNLIDLRSVMVLAEHLNFGRAAAELGVSQSALSQRIAKVEERMGCRLFERTGRQCVATPEGDRAVRQIRRVMEEADRLSLIAAERSQTLAGTYRIGVIPTLGPYYLPHLLPVLKREFPDLRLQWREGMTRELSALLLDGALDFALMAAPVEMAGLSSVPLFEEPFTLIAPADHWLAERESVEPEHLERVPMVLLSEGHCLREQALDLCGKGANECTIQATGLEILRHLVASGAGCSLMPSLAVPENPGELVRYLPVSGEPYRRRIGLYFRTNWARAQDVEALAEAIREHLPNSVEPAAGTKTVSAANP